MALVAVENCEDRSAVDDLRLAIERAAARARTSTAAVIQQLTASSVPEAKWIEYFTERGNPYYYNDATGESRWELPVPESLGLTLDIYDSLSNDSGITKVHERRTSQAYNHEEQLARVHVDKEESEVDDSTLARDSANEESGGTIGAPLLGAINAIVQHAEENEEEIAVRESYEARISLAARAMVTAVFEKCLDAYVSKCVQCQRQKAKAAQSLLLKTSHADYRLNKKAIPPKSRALAALEIGFSDELGDEDSETDSVILRQRRRQSVAQSQRSEQEARELKAKAKERKDILEHDTGLDDDLDDRRMSRYIERKFAELHAGGRFLRRLNMVECDLGDGYVHQLARALANSAVSHLELGSNKITCVGAVALSACAHTCLSLRIMHLNNNDIGDEGVTALCDKFFGVASKASSGFANDAKKGKALLTLLNLTSNPSSARAAKTVATALTLHGCQLKTLRLGGAGLAKAAFKPNGEAARAISEVVPGNRGAVLIAAALLAPSCSDGNRAQACLTSLSLVHCGIGRDGARAIAAALYCEPPLLHLDLTDNPLEGPGIGSLELRSLQTKGIFACDFGDPSAPHECQALEDIRVGGLNLVPDGGVVALARALEATSTLQSVVKADDVPVQRYLQVFACRALPNLWKRRRELGADACFMRAWLLKVSVALGLSIPSHGSAIAIAQMDFAKRHSDPHAGSHVEDSVTELGGMRFEAHDSAETISRRQQAKLDNSTTCKQWCEFITQVGALWPPENLRKLLHSANLCREAILPHLDKGGLLEAEVPGNATWHELTRARLMLKVYLNALQEKVDSAQTKVAAARSKTATARTQASASRELRKQMQANSPNLADQQKELHAAVIKARLDTLRAKSEDSHVRQEIARAKSRQTALLRGAAFLVADTVRYAAELKGEVAVQALRNNSVTKNGNCKEAQESQFPMRSDEACTPPPDISEEAYSDISKPAAKTSYSKTKIAAEEAAMLELSAKLRLETLKTACNATNRLESRVREALESALKTEHRLSSNLKVVSELQRAGTFEQENDERQLELTLRVAQNEACEIEEEAKALCTVAGQLEAYLLKLEKAIQLSQTQMMQELIAVPTGLQAIDHAQYEAGCEQLRASAAFAAAEAALSRCKTPREQALCLAQRAVASAQHADASTRAEESRLDAIAFQLSNHDIVTITMLEHNKDSVNAIKPTGDALAASFNIATVRLLIAAEQRQKEATNRHLQLVAQRKRCRAEAQRKLKALKKLSPRSQFSDIERRIEAVRKHGYPKTEERIALLRRLRELKAAAKRAVRKQQRETLEAERRKAIFAADGRVALSPSDAITPDIHVSEEEPAPAPALEPESETTIGSGPELQLAAQFVQKPHTGLTVHHGKYKAAL